MAGHVAQQRPLTAEHFAAVRAAERSLACMNPSVGLEMFLSDKYFPTFGAAERFLDSDIS